ncbi:TPA: hypothetical protein DEG21_05505 [Patescibacteria group bacterium]|nr:hypothetical protein [Candidatus Gracilibacteria bacterium]HBY75278.1 hypothetical protein [Candidatus Gracilibacteria bacterium]
MATILIKIIFFLQYLSDNLPNIIPQINIQTAAADTVIHTVSELPQKDLTIKGKTGRIKLNPRISRKLRVSKV